ncbi:MAG: phosphatidylserine decarboxylase [Hyphomicrobiaceae bacterium]
MLVPIHRDGHKFLATGAIVTFILFFVWPRLAMLALLATLWLAFFFRDPDRVTPLRDGLVIAPADGRIIAVENVRTPQELGLGEELRTRVSIHLSPFDVHVNRSPVAGRVARSVYVPGAFYNPTLDKASEDNERRGIIIATPAGVEIAVVQIAGIVSRRIVTFAGEGDTLAAGQRFGLIRFGSRVDVYLPPGKAAFAAVGQRAIAGETVIADLESNERPRDVRRG